MGRALKKAAVRPKKRNTIGHGEPRVLFSCEEDSEPPRFPHKVARSFLDPDPFRLLCAQISAPAVPPPFPGGPHRNPPDDNADTSTVYARAHANDHGDRTRSVHEQSHVRG